MLVRKLSESFFPFVSSVSLIKVSVFPFFSPLIFTSVNVGSSSISISNEILLFSTFVTKTLISLNNSNPHNLLITELTSSPGTFIFFSFLRRIYEITVYSLYVLILLNVRESSS